MHNTDPAQHIITAGYDLENLQEIEEIVLTTSSSLEKFPRNFRGRSGAGQKMYMYNLAHGIVLCIVLSAFGFFLNGEFRVTYIRKNSPKKEKGSRAPETIKGAIIRTPQLLLLIVYRRTRGLQAKHQSRPLGVYSKAYRLARRWR